MNSNLTIRQEFRSLSPFARVVAIGLLAFVVVATFRFVPLVEWLSR